MTVVVPAQPAHSPGTAAGRGGAEPGMPPGWAGMTGRMVRPAAYRTLTNSTSNRRVALAGITPPAPLLP
jgi:hypothetical protein